MPIINGVIGFRAGGGGGDTVYTLLGEPVTVDVVTPTVSVEVTTPVISIDVATGVVEVVIP